ncbi:Stf0 family sulfotransferase [Xanthomonas prunicola]|jgi:LPS sulfotransferase NodH|uniref:Sulphotransferase Stf0 domain-containing protein n=1 Tax=Xanthomonas prunicola TaxID=2053930 RepID=A0A2N3RLR6_9XANT|nr:Stf0 family sulfotransferase [Xanthomonas prunicola]PKV13415.1 hypothetical protein XpruCFBP8353_09440 [Xanthomonas prunicola]PKV17690.1 hypothetical protein XpruCFBP8354_09440 [Xanthomonas prunicola]PKV21588.1 hypothetical protein CVO74_11495 [Xanthomonas prunicola]
MHRISPIYTADFDFDGSVEPRLKVMVAAIPRSGSTYFCLELWRSGAFGAPAEYLNLMNRREDMIPRLASGDIVKYWSEVQRLRTGPNGVFSYKAFIQDFRQINSTEPRLLKEIGADKVIYLRRRNREEQAISYSRAFQSNAWFADVREQATPVYSLDNITTALDWISSLESSWERIFERKNCAPLRLWYEDIVEQPIDTLKQVSAYTGVALEDARAIWVPRIKRQRDLMTDQWLGHYQREKTERSTQQRK